MSDSQDIVKQIGEVERRISDGESLLRRVSNASLIGWVFLLFGVLLIIFLPDIYKVVGVLVVGASIWRLYTAEKYKREIEDGLREYRGRKAELNASLTSKQ